MGLRSSLQLLVLLSFLLDEARPATTTRLGDLSNPDAQMIQLTEPERREEYAKRNYTWPLNNYSPDTPGWKALMEERFAQIAEMDANRYEGYIQTIHSAFLGE